MAELAAIGKFHEVDDAEADGVIEASSHAILHNEAFGRVIRNMYGRLQVLEKEIAELKDSQKSKVEMPRRGLSQ
jgi:hypothetical protein